VTAIACSFANTNVRWCTQATHRETSQGVYSFVPRLPTQEVSVSVSFSISLSLLRFTHMFYMLTSLSERSRRYLDRNSNRPLLLQLGHRFASIPSSRLLTLCDVPHSLGKRHERPILQASAPKRLCLATKTLETTTEVDDNDHAEYGWLSHMLLTSRFFVCVRVSLQRGRLSDAAQQLAKTSAFGTASACGRSSRSASQ
jgi:hypothetical protein